MKSEKIDWHEKRLKVLGGRRITGTIVSWRGAMGWVVPDSEIDHPEAEMHDGKVFLHRSDLEAGANHDLLRGARVNFTVYADGSGLGAQQCRVLTLGEPSKGKGKAKGKGKGKSKGKGKGKGREDDEGEVRGVKRTIGKRPLVGKFAARTLGGQARRTDRPEPWVKGGARADPAEKGYWGKSGAKGKGKGKGKTKAKGKGKGVKGKGKRKGPKEEPPRKRIGFRRTGTVLRWSRNFGWIEASEPIEHRMAEKHKGEIFVHISDIMGGKQPREGDSVDFLPYADRTGLGAEKCRILERADGNDEGEELEELDDLEEAEAAAAEGMDDEEEAEAEGEEPEAQGLKAKEELKDLEDEEPTASQEVPAEEAEEAEAEEGQEGEEAEDEDQKVRGLVDDLLAEAKGKAKGKADAKGKAKGKDKKGGDKGKGKAGSKGKASDAYGVQRTIEKRPPALAPPAQKGKAAAGGAGKGAPAGKGKGSAVVMTSKPKASSAGGGKADAKGGKADAKGGKAPAAGGKAPAPGGKGPAFGGKAAAANGKGPGAGGGKPAPPGGGGKPAPGAGKPGLNGKGGSKAAKGGGKTSAAAPNKAPFRPGGLPENWEEHWSEEHGVPYFWNKKTKESKWLRPSS